MAWVERMLPSEQDDQFESWRKEFQQERLLRIVREREIMKETAKRCKSYKVREQEANEALERKRQSILSQRKAANIQATMRFQRNLPGFTVMDQEKFDQALETITGRTLSNRSTPRRPSAVQQQRVKPNTILRRSISMEELGSRQQQALNSNKVNQRNQTILVRTNSAMQIPQQTNAVQYTSPLQEVQRRVLTDFAAQVQTTLNQDESYNDATTWERESVDSLEASNQLHSQTINSQHKIPDPAIRSNRTVNIQTRKSQQPPANNSQVESKTNHDQQEMMRRSYHESFFVKNTPVTGNEQVAAWLGANKISAPSSTHTDIIEKPLSLDGHDPDTNGRRKSILKRSPSIDNLGTNTLTNTKPVVPARKANVQQLRTIQNQGRVKDSLEVINAKLLKELDVQKKTVRFAQDADGTRCASETLLTKETTIEKEQQSLRRVQSAALLTPPPNHSSAK